MDEPEHWEGSRRRGLSSEEREVTDLIGPQNNDATFIGFGRSGVAHYRCAMPARELGAGLFIRDDKTLAPIRELGIRNAPVVIYSMPWQDFQIAECLQILEGGGKLIIDCDDYLRGCIGKTDLMVEFDEERVSKHEEILKRAHLVTCSTQWLADKLEAELGVETMVCPNGVDLDRFNLRKMPRNKEATILAWSGGAGHLDAFKQIAPAIDRVMDERPKVAFVSVGAPAPEVAPSSLLKHAGSDRVADAGFHPIYDHATIMCQFHIGLAPAVDNDFYRAKSPIRYLEQAAAYVATIGQHPTYELLNETLKTGGSFLTAQASTDAWVESILSLVDNPKERYLMTKRAHKFVRENHSIAQTAPKWRAAIDRALEMS